MKQRKLSKSLGNDSHVRTVGKNIFQKQSTGTHEILTGEVLINQAEPFFSQNAVTVSLTKGGTITAVPVAGAFIDPITGNLHGSYDGPITGQMVTIGFVGGNSSAPIMLNKYPYQAVGNTLKEGSFITPMYLAGYDCTDTLMGHFSGSVIGLYTGLNALGGRIPGEVGIDAFTACNITAQTDIILNALASAEVSATLVKIDGSATVEINGNTKQFVTWTELNTQIQALMLALSVPLIVTGTAAGGLALTATAMWAIPPTIDITSAKTIKTLTGG